jgi:hypothetical protein
MAKEEDIRTGGNLHCPFCGTKYENDGLADADYIIDFHGTDKYCEDWFCYKCKKPATIATAFDPIV